MIKKLIGLTFVATLLASCASIPTEYKSPCACDYKRINVPTDPNEEEKAVA